MDAVILDDELVPLLELAPAFQLSVDTLPEIHEARTVASRSSSPTRSSAPTTS